MAIPRNATGGTAVTNAATEMQKLNALRDIAACQRMISNTLQSILATLQRMEQKRK